MASWQSQPKACICPEKPFILSHTLEDSVQFLTPATCFLASSSSRFPQTKALEQANEEDSVAYSGQVRTGVHPGHREAAGRLRRAQQASPLPSRAPNPAADLGRQHRPWAPDLPSRTTGSRGGSGSSRSCKYNVVASRSHPRRQGRTSATGGDRAEVNRVHRESPRNAHGEKAASQRQHRVTCKARRASELEGRMKGNTCATPCLPPRVRDKRGNEGTPFQCLDGPLRLILEMKSPK